MSRGEHGDLKDERRLRSSTAAARRIISRGLMTSAAAPGLDPGTIRMWEQRYGFPEPERTSAGYRVYSEADVKALRRVLAYRERGLSIPAAVDRARPSDLATDRRRSTARSSPAMRRRPRRC